MDFLITNFVILNFLNKFLYYLDSLELLKLNIFNQQRFIAILNNFFCLNFKTSNHFKNQ